MKKTTSLAILQQSEYDLSRWKKWLMAHHDDDHDIEPTEWTPKLKAINLLSSLLFFLPTIFAIQIAVWITQPIEYLIRQRAYRRAQRKLLGYRQQGLKVVAIAGSYAKTSTKEILFHTLSGEQSVLITPKSINTMLGVAQIIEKELQPTHTLFVVEMGEYHRGDIKQLCQFVQPDFGILAPIGHQHLDILGGFDQVVAELSELIEYFCQELPAVISHETNRRYFPDHALTYYGTDDASQWRVTQAKVTRAGTEFSVQLPDTTPLHLFSPLFGEHQAVNTLPSFWLGHKLDIPVEIIKKKIATLPYIHRRHEPTFAANDVLILDNSYNTNADSVPASLKLMNQLSPTRRVVITLGFTETGSAAETLHHQLGATLANQSDYVGLIQAPWTTAIIDGFTDAGGKRDQIVIGKTQDDAFAQLQEYIIPGTVILFEGGYQEVYV